MILPRYALYAAMLAAAGLPIYIHAPKYFVDTYGLSLTQISAVLVALRLIDVVQDPLLGRLAGRLHQRRALAATIAATGLALGMVGLFVIPAPTAPLVWLSLCLILLFTSYSFLTILFYARGITQSRSLGPDGHVRLAGWRETGALIGVSLASVAPFLLGPATAPGYAAFALGFVVLVAIAATAMRPVWPGKLDIPRASFAGLLADRDLRRLLLIAFLNAAPVAVTSSLFLFFVEYRLGATNLSGVYLLAFFVAAAAAAPLWSRAARSYGAVPTLSLGMVLSIVAFAFAFTLETGDTTAFLIICLASGAALGADMTLLPALYATRVDQIGGNGGEAFGLWSLFSKLTLAIAAATALPLLEAGGFRTGPGNSADALARISLLYALLPCALKLAALGLLQALPKPKVLTCSNP